MLRSRSGKAADGGTQAVRSQHETDAISVSRIILPLRFVPRPFAPCACFNALVTGPLIPDLLVSDQNRCAQTKLAVSQTVSYFSRLCTEACVVVASVSDGYYSGRGEAAPIKRYGQSPESVLAEIQSIKKAPSLDRRQLQKLLPPGAARNALDCALWDLEAKVSGKRVWELTNLPIVEEVETSFTISLDAPAAMAVAARADGSAPS